ncbi:hypothetical protein KQ302_01890 [Synechococcus sp. CS-602]|uniref:hypothetical protein n=1 Tax=Synechococcaceae TaxID=1890426 RepID=UPI000AF553F2|nr:MULTISPECIES: hypothetical protein [Synechococcaceae]MCT4364692.1 hypothetical protein [Candidatus Regnicoccus frigidus MAG-AL1]MCT0201764.1 hypothetical protein [Synechococcus sp. CS-603]MCT0203870.1 hypothetical protein [Synechococcus sp. CS-602]MCT0244724.1 hypothetical protein [Synechococcus sp. CS-601]MCT4366602.1 hypothetical protein [Candidatus Regnicoccus frigidus MAG-AL2]
MAQGSAFPPAPGCRLHLQRCLRLECDLDPLILRARLLRSVGQLGPARCLEQELLPLL